MRYKYGMRMRGFSPGCRPRHPVDREDDPSGKYYDIVIYDRRLSEEELKDYELDFLGNSDI